MKMTLLKEKNSLVLCSMNYLKTILIFILCINLSTDEVINEDYKIEMIIFLNQDIDTEELFSSKLVINLGKPDANNNFKLYNSLFLLIL